MPAVGHRGQRAAAAAGARLPGAPPLPAQHAGAQTTRTPAVPFCLDGGGQPSVGSDELASIRLCPCDTASATQLWAWDPASLHLRNLGAPGGCMDSARSGSTWDDEFVIQPCIPGRSSQQLRFSTALGQLSNVDAAGTAKFCLGFFAWEFAAPGCYGPALVQVCEGNLFHLKQKLQVFAG